MKKFDVKEFIKLIKNVRGSLMNYVSKNEIPYPLIADTEKVIDELYLIIYRSEHGWIGEDNDG